MLVLGKPLPDFALTVVDNARSSRKVSNADLAGKVVVIACWSMHNKSCFEDLRQIQKIVQAAKADDRVVLVALECRSRSRGYQRADGARAQVSFRKQGRA